MSISSLLFYQYFLKIKFFTIRYLQAVFFFNLDSATDTGELSNVTVSIKVCSVSTSQSLQNRIQTRHC